jgi:Tol biopolymer transport system component
MDTGKEAIIYIYDLEGTSSMRRLTFGGSNRYPVWSADSRRVASQSDREGDHGIFWQRADGTGTVERLTRAEEGFEHIPESWSRHGEHLAFSRLETNKSAALVWIFSPADRKASALNTAGVRALRAAFSPDGKWLAYQSGERDRAKYLFSRFRRPEPNTRSAGLVTATIRYGRPTGRNCSTSRAPGNS